jgi:serine/threonine protein kinase
MEQNTPTDLLDTLQWTKTLQKHVVGSTPGCTINIKAPSESSLYSDYTELEEEDSLSLMNLIGQGGMADVFRASQESLERDIAIKVLRGDSSTSAQGHFSAEAKITGGLDHPNIVPIHDLLTLPSGAKALLMKHIDGETWLKRIKRSRASECFDLPRELSVLCDLCDAVAFAHSRGVIHLDIKPANVMVGEYGQTLLMDWGCAAIIDETRWRNQPELPRAKELIQISGTPIYMAPEQAIGSLDKFGTVTDIYALGAVLYNLIAGTDMRHGEDIESVLKLAAHGTVPPLPSSAPPGLGKICLEAVNPNTEQRISSAIELRDRINAWLNTRESRQLTQNALKRLQGIDSAKAASDEAAIELKELLSLLQRSLESWPQNTLAEQGVVDTAHKLAVIAIKRDEPALAAQYANLLPAQHTQKKRLLSIAGEITKRQARAKTRSKILSFALWGLGATIIAALIAISTLFVRVDTERQRAVALKTFSSHMLTSVDPAIAQGMDNASAGIGIGIGIGAGIR